MPIQALLYKNKRFLSCYFSMPYNALSENYEATGPLAGESC